MITPLQTYALSADTENFCYASQLSYFVKIIVLAIKAIIRSNLKLAFIRSLFKGAEYLNSTATPMSLCLTISLLNTMSTDIWVIWN